MSDAVLAAMLRQQIEQVGKQDDPVALDFIASAKRGSYLHSPPVSPEYIGLTREEFLALHALAYHGR